MPKAEIEKRQRSLYIMAQCHCINFKKKRQFQSLRLKLPFLNSCEVVSYLLSLSFLICYLEIKARILSVIFFLASWNI